LTSAYRGTKYGKPPPGPKGLRKAGPGPKTAWDLPRPGNARQTQHGTTASGTGERGTKWGDYRDSKRKACMKCG